MFDLFGLRKNEAESAVAEPPEPSSAPASGGGSQKLWAILLVVDSLFVIVFGGGVAAKLYQHWKAPSQMPISHSARVSKKVKPAAPETAAPVATAQEAPPPPPPAPPAPTPPAPVVPEPAKTGPKGRPSLLAESPKAHQAAKPQEAAPKPDPAGDKPKAVAVEFKLKSPKAKEVLLAGAFIVRGNGQKAMAARGEGIWGLTLYLTPNTYRYWFVVDGKKLLDPENPKTERGASLLSIP